MHSEVTNGAYRKDISLCPMIMELGFNSVICLYAHENVGAMHPPSSRVEQLTQICGRNERDIS